MCENLRYDKLTVRKWETVYMFDVKSINLTGLTKSTKRHREFHGAFSFSKRSGDFP